MDPRLPFVVDKEELYSKLSQFFINLVITFADSVRTWVVLTSAYVHPRNVLQRRVFLIGDERRRVEVTRTDVILDFELIVLKARPVQVVSACCWVYHEDWMLMALD